MKKRLIVCLVSLAVLVLAVSPVWAQSMDKGFKFGLSMADWSGDDIDDQFKSRTGFALGGYFGFQLAEGFTLQPEILYVQKGSQVKESGDRIVFRVDYLEFPILVKYAFAVAPGTKIFLFAGPALSLKISSSLFYDIEGETGTEDFNDVQALDYGLTFGGGFEIPFGSMRLGADLRYTLGLAKCLNDDFGDPLDIKNGAFLALIGIGF